MHFVILWSVVCTHVHYSTWFDPPLPDKSQISFHPHHQYPHQASCVHHRHPPLTVNSVSSCCLHPLVFFPSSMSSRKLRGSNVEKPLSPEEQQDKINEVRKLIGPIAYKLPTLCCDASIRRYLRARNWNPKKAYKMLKDSIKWTLDYKPQKIRWEDIADEAEIGRIYRADYFDKFGRTVLIMRPAGSKIIEPKSSTPNGQIRYLVYCLENAIINSKEDQEQMVWLIDFHGWNMACISAKVTKETTNVLQNHYPERLGIAILYNPPKLFASFWMMVKPFLEPKTCNKVKFVYSDDPQSQKIMENLFNMDDLDSAFGGKSLSKFDMEAYKQKMIEEDRRTHSGIFSGTSTPSYQPSVNSESQSDSLAVSECASEDGMSSGDEKAAVNLEALDEKLKDLQIIEAEAAPKEEEINGGCVGC